MLHPHHHGLRTPLGVYPNPNYGGGGVWYYPSSLHTLKIFHLYFPLLMLFSKDILQIEFFAKKKEAGIRFLLDKDIPSLYCHFNIFPSPIGCVHPFVQL